VAAEPSGAPLFKSCTMPVGPTPELCVLIVTVSWGDCPAQDSDGMPVSVVEVGALVIVTGTVGDVLGM
jgi:hypothetical protein